MVRKLVRILPTGLMIRSGIYYFRMDVKKQNGTYTSIRHTLKTKNLDKAIQGTLFMKDFMRKYNELTPEEQIDFVNYYTHENGAELTQAEKQELINGNPVSIIGLAYDAWIAQKLNPEELIQTVIENRPVLDLCKKGFEDSAYERYKARNKAMEEIIYAKYFLDIYAQKHPEIMNEYNDVIDMANESQKHEIWEQYKALREGKPISIIISDTKNSSPALTPPKHTIQEVFDLMIGRQQFAKSTIKKRKSDFNIIMQYAELSMNDDCAKLINLEIINKIINSVKNRENTKGDRKNDIFATLKRFLEHAHKFEKSYDTESLVYLLPIDFKTAKQDKQPKMPFKDEHLSQIFNPQQEYFKHEPEQFLACIIALFTGGRVNSVVTLKYKNICKDNDHDIYYIEFIDDEDPNTTKKELKTDASIRKVPIAKQLLDWGFIEMLQKRQQQLNATDNDFIFSKTKRLASPSANFMKNFSGYVCKVADINKNDSKSYSFHSFRKTVSNKLKDLGIEQTIINDICGWDGETTMEKYYSIHYLEDLKPHADRIIYPEDILHLEAWKNTIQDLYIKQEKIKHKRKPYKKKINI